MNLPHRVIELIAEGYSKRSAQTIISIWETHSLLRYYRINILTIRSKNSVDLSIRTWSENKVGEEFIPSEDLETIVSKKYTLKEFEEEFLKEE